MKGEKKSIKQNLSSVEVILTGSAYLRHSLKINDCSHQGSGLTILVQIKIKFNLETSSVLYYIVTASTFFCVSLKNYSDKC